MKKASTPKRPKLKSTAGDSTEGPAGRRDEMRIVGIGASAGGLEALEQFLSHVPPGSGLAYVVIQHLDPAHKGYLADILQRATPMKVSVIKDGMRVLPDNVYVIPRNKDLSVTRCLLRLHAARKTQGIRMPIDHFFRSLADTQRSSAVGVVLSGLGSDGAAGLRAIKNNGGLTLVQEPANAKFDGMPRSAIDSGPIDVIAAVEELPGRIFSHRGNKHPVDTAARKLQPKVRDAFKRILALLRSRTGSDFSQYKRDSIHRRIERRMSQRQISTISAYVDHLENHPKELEALFKDILIGVTSFFRDPEVWDQLRDNAIPEMLAQAEPGKTLRAWVPACSTGEEAYSLAIIFKEAVGKLKQSGNYSLQIYATDLDTDAIDTARRGVYPAKIASEVSKVRLKRYFKEDGNGYRVRGEIRDMVIFAPQNLVMDPPFTKLDFLSCRNLLIYLNAEVQSKLLPLFHYSLAPGGLLILGRAESIGGASDLFKPLLRESRLFWRKKPDLTHDLLDFPASLFGRRDGGPPSTAPVKPPVSLQALGDQAVLKRFGPPAILVNEKGEILYVNGNTGRYLAPPTGKANWNLFAMARESIRYELFNAFKDVVEGAGKVVLHGLSLDGGTDGPLLEVNVQRLTEPGSVRGFVMFVFTESSKRKSAKVAQQRGNESPESPRIVELEQEIEQVRHESRASNEQMQTSMEELRSSNEELQSTIEELQSTNEELTTAKEEMQSVNEELQTVNQELQSKVMELTRSSDDMKNLLDSTDIATLFLDKDLKVRRFTPQATSIIKLIPGDVGRPITDLRSILRYSDLSADAREVLEKLQPVEKSISAVDGRWFTVRIMPYRTVDDRIDGVVITLADITVAKKLEAKLRKENPPTRADSEEAPLKTGRKHKSREA